QVIAAIEYKTPAQLKTQRLIQVAIRQEIEVARALGAHIYIITDGKKTFWINPLTGNEVVAENNASITLNFGKDSHDCIKLISKAIVSLSETNDKILASVIVDPLPLAQKVWQDLWSVSGATPENCLYTFVEIFIFKYLSDLGVLAGFYSFNDLLNRYGTNSDNQVIEYYASTIRPEIKRLFPGNPKDKTSIINGTIFVSKDDKAVAGYATVFKKILLRFDEFGTLENIDYDFKSKLFETFLKESISKKNWGQFFTPLKVVRAIVNMADISPNMKICDPACGVGKFLLEPMLHDINRYFKVENGQLKVEIALSGFDKGFDKDEQKTIILAKANMLIYLSSLIRDNPNITQQFAQLFNDTFLLQTNSILGTLAHPTENEYDLILTNPPYVMSGSSNLKEEISKDLELKQYFSINAMGIEGLFMEWIVRALKPGGKAFVIVPDGIMYRSNDKRLRDFILEECFIDAVISLPLNTFFTTNKKTYILALTKKIPNVINGIPSFERQDNPVFTYLCSEIGETRDVYRFDISQNDLVNAVTNFNMFKGAKSYFSTTDNRCKIVSIDKFYNGIDWSIQNWWTENEKIELGIEDEVNTISVDGFLSLIDDVATSITEFEEPLREMLKKKPQYNMRHVKISDIFTITRGNGKYTRTYSKSHQGNYPVYSASANAPLTYISTYDFDGDYLSWSTNGFAGTVTILHDKFSINGDRGLLIPKHEGVNIQYIQYILQPILRKIARGRKGDRGTAEFTKLHPSMLVDVIIPIPTDEDGNIDIFAQQEIADNYTTLSEFRNLLSDKYNEIKDYNILIELNNYSMQNIPLSKLLQPIKGKSKYTKKYGEAHKGNYPVYSASANTALTYTDTYDFDGDYLSWSTNGFAGTVTILHNKFSINGDRGLLIPKHESIDIQYLKYFLEPVFRKMARGRKGDRGTDEFTKLYPSMIVDVLIPLPIDENENLDLPAQQEIAGKYESIELCKQELLDKLKMLIEQKVTLY
ncbi:MAG: N-6 DNA methylase, partial [Candidatus Cloacimonetes bacterium]|nr:N-6 DNA methylase [Candidatus Cloacimonadota bacterium]MDY0230583.1 N-6 DNA methylase [Candidatus Cloacimonadaceae bacterium]